MKPWTVQWRTTIRSLGCIPVLPGKVIIHNKPNYYKKQSKHVVWLIVVLEFSRPNNSQPPQRTPIQSVCTAMPLNHNEWTVITYSSKFKEMSWIWTHLYFQHKHFKWWLLSTWWVCPYQIVAEPLHKKWDRYSVEVAKFSHSDLGFAFSTAQWWGTMISPKR